MVYTTYAFNKDFVMNTRGVYEHLLSIMERNARENRRLKQKVADLEAMQRLGLTMNELIKNTIKK